MSKFDLEDKPRPNKLIQIKERTMLDDLTDVSWLEGETKKAAQARFLETRGQYFDNGVRHTE